ncbi:invasion associated locus B family protein [Marinivivus vitaminiproducens]|uniref:invasion associated locus B family protein n=1 Tax=Marinivivus vitaminiproducens TaxID=3035935 RepID=UPI0027A232CB|nr:invasion associated locus B family protein [Geminicoccaceae bacterium SCSIO 64248]
MRVHARLLAAALFVGGLLAGQPASAQQPTFVGSYRDWNVYTATVDGRFNCYIASVPKKEEGSYQRRDPAAVLVTRVKGSTTDEVSVRSGYPYNQNSTVALQIGNQRWDLFTQGETAWASTSDEDRAIIGAMRAGTDMTARGTSQRNTFSLDTYSLLGFTAAYESMTQTCS